MKSGKNLNSRKELKNKCIEMKPDMGIYLVSHNGNNKYFIDVTKI